MKAIRKSSSFVYSRKYVCQVPVGTKLYCCYFFLPYKLQYKQCPKM